MTTETGEELPLAGFTVLELGEGVSAPYCGRLLAGCGADVIKVEPPDGDPARRQGPFPDDLPHPEKAALFQYLNNNKKGVTLDFSTASGGGLLRRLVEEVDVLVENQPPGRLEGAGLSYRELARVNNRLLMVSVKPFGETPFSQVEYEAGLNAFAATLAALLGLAVMEVGQHVEISALECQAAAREACPPAHADQWPNIPVLPSRVGWGWRTGRAPLLGGHNEEVFGGLLGLERPDLVRLRAAGVV